MDAWTLTLIVLLILFYLRKPLKKFLNDLSEVTFKAGPIETTAKRQQVIEAAASLFSLFLRGDKKVATEPMYPLLHPRKRMYRHGPRSE